jgi:glycerol-3-phosphate cytidylyltransferase-like family protein
MASDVKKTRKRRKPMSEEQRAAAAERLRLAREKRLKENPPEYKSIHPAVVARGEDDPLSMKNVKQWIKTQKELASVERKNVKTGVKGAEAKLAAHEGYVRQMEAYLRGGDWQSLFWGEYEQNRMKSVCLVMAYDKDGYPKRNVGTYYPDISMEWTQEMDEEYRGQRKK